jgi:hypothetical protein
MFEARPDAHRRLFNHPEGELSRDKNQWVRENQQAAL